MRHISDMGHLGLVGFCLVVGTMTFTGASKHAPDPRVPADAASSRETSQPFCQPRCGTCQEVEPGVWARLCINRECEEYTRPCTPPPPPVLNLTGTWSADDGGLYYLRQVGNTLWWLGLSTDSVPSVSDFHGLSFTNVFRGTIDAASSTVAGSWADVPRGTILQDGTLDLEILNPTGSTELRRRSETGGFGGSLWRRVNPSYPLCTYDIRCKFDQTMRNDDDTMHEHLKMYKDNVVVFTEGPLIQTLTVNHPHSVGRSYSDFMCPWWWPPIFGDPPDGDITLLARFDRNNLDAQPNFWNRADGWMNDPDQIRRKLDHQFNNEIHPEIIMYGRPAGRGNCAGLVAPLLPGWMEVGANSVLWNGLPVDGQVVIDSSNPDRIPDFRAHAARIFNQTLPASARLRITGFLAVDCHGGECDEDKPWVHNVEIHPVYSIDVIQNFAQSRPAATFTGVWAASDVGTYYVRQIGNTIWWLGVSRDRGRTFTNVFQGTLLGRTEVGEWLIEGDWADVPRGVFMNYGAVSLRSPASLSSDSPSSLRATSVGVFGDYTWEKLYDVPRPDGDRP